MKKDTTRVSDLLAKVWTLAVRKFKEAGIFCLPHEIDVAADGAMIIVELKGSTQEHAAQRGIPRFLRSPSRTALETIGRTLSPESSLEGVCFDDDETPHVSSSDGAPAEPVLKEKAVAIAKQLDDAVRFAREQGAPQIGTSVLVAEGLTVTIRGPDGEMRTKCVETIVGLHDGHDRLLFPGRTDEVVSQAVGFITDLAVGADIVGGKATN